MLSHINGTSAVLLLGILMSWSGLPLDRGGVWLTRHFICRLVLHKERLKVDAVDDGVLITKCWSKYAWVLWHVEEDNAAVRVPVWLMEDHGGGTSIIVSRWWMCVCIYKYRFCTYSMIIIEDGGTVYVCACLCLRYTVNSRQKMDEILRVMLIPTTTSIAYIGKWD